MNEGTNAIVRRSIGTPELRQLSPFLLLDHFEKSPANAFFPDHPHSGIETVTRVLEGTILHEDFLGSRGSIGQGDIQIMTAGRGIMHAEVPQPGTSGLQLWVDLPKPVKEIDPGYRTIRAGNVQYEVVENTVGSQQYWTKLNEISTVDESITKANTIFWEYEITSCGNEQTPSSSKKVESSVMAEIETQDIPANWNTVVYIIEGTVDSSSSSSLPEQETNHVGPYNLLVYSCNSQDPSRVKLAFDPTQTRIRFVVMAGEPLDQEIHRNIFFVQTSKEQLSLRKTQFRKKMDGFARARDWKSQFMREREQQQQ
jgi:redox-sensitive bicupin YhaK (pirin superfamily)